MAYYDRLRDGPATFADPLAFDTPRRQAYQPQYEAVSADRYLGGGGNRTSSGGLPLRYNLGEENNSYSAYSAGRGRTPTRWEEQPTATAYRLTPGGPGAPSTAPRAMSTPRTVGTPRARYGGSAYEDATPATSYNAVSRVLEPSYEPVEKPYANRLSLSDGIASFHNAERAMNRTPTPTKQVRSTTPTAGGRGGSVYRSGLGNVTYVQDSHIYERAGSPQSAHYTSHAATPSFDGRVCKMPSMVKEANMAFIPEAHPQDRGKLVVVLDLDETLVYAREGRTIVRPGARELLHRLKGKCELMVWTAGERDYAQSVIRQLDQYNAIQHCVYRHPKWWTGKPGYTKNLLALGRPLDRTIIIDNTPDCLRDHPSHSLLVTDYLGKPHESSDQTMHILTGVLEEMIDQPNKSVPQVLAQHPDIAMRTVACDAGGRIDVYTLAKDHHLGASSSAGYSRYNRDMPAYRISQW